MLVGLSVRRHMLPVFDRSTQEIQKGRLWAPGHALSGFETGGRNALRLKNETEKGARARAW